jgi:hypothetical protein
LKSTLSPYYIATFGFSIGGFPTIQNSDQVDKAMIYKSFWNITMVANGLYGSILSYLYNVSLKNNYCLSHLFRSNKDINVLFSHKDEMMGLESSLLYGYHYYLTKLLFHNGNVFEEDYKVQSIKELFKRWFLIKEV